MVRNISLWIGIMSCCFSLVFLAGCGRTVDPNEAIASVNKTNIQRLANLYFTYQMKNRWKGPKNEADFKKFISSYNPAKLTRIGIDPNAIDALFINERDGEPFKIRYSVAGSAMGSSEPVIFESVGDDGKRLVGFLNMEQREVDQSEYDSLWAAKGSSKRTSRQGLRER
jgi:hypothetical protein